LDPSNYVTLNEALATAGYRSAIVGKWHLDTDFKNPKGNPKQHGFDEVIGSETKYIADGDYFFPYDKISTFSEGKENEYLTDRQYAEASGFIERNKKQPFFLYLALYSVHTRLAAPESTVTKYKRKFDAKYGAGMADKFFEGDNGRHEANHKDNPYLAAMLEHIDAGVGRIVETLKKTGLDKNTMVVFFSDNGGAGKVANNGHLRGTKTWLYEGGIRENLLIKWPAQIKPSIVTDAVVSSIDFYPTFIEMAGVKKPKDHLLDGQSLLPLLTKGVEPNRETLYWHYPSETGKWVPRMASAIRKGDYKLLEFYVDGRLELYDLKNDPSEKNNLAASMPGIVKELKKMLDDWKKDVNAEDPVLTPDKKMAGK
jgi:arylsulfatase A